MPTSITRASAWPSSAACSRRRAFASASSRSRTGTARKPSRRSGRPNLFFGVTAGNMDSMVNRYTSDRRVRSDDAYTPGGVGGKRPDRSVIVYAQRVREAFKDVPIVIGGIEASLRRIAHFDYWSEKVRRSVLLDAKADMLVYGNGERQICEIAHRLAAGEAISEITDIRGTAFTRKSVPAGWVEIDSDAPGCARTAEPAGGSLRHGADAAPPDAARRRTPRPPRSAPREQVVRFVRRVKSADREHSVIRLPAFEQVARRSGAVRACLAHPAPGGQPRQRARAGAASRRRRRVAEPAAAFRSPPRRWTGCTSAVSPRAAPDLRRRAHSGVQDDPLLGRHPARLLRRLHLLLDHRARGPHHPEPLGGLGDPRDRGSARQRCRASPA